MTAFQDSPAVYLKLVDVSYGSLAVNQRRSLNDCFLSKESLSWAQTTTSQLQEAPKK